MDAHSFASYYSGVRDHGLSLKDSWFTRFGELGDCPEYFRVWTLVPFEDVTTDDVLWALVAAALDPVASHLLLYVHPHTCTDPDAKIEELEKELREYGFLPYGLDWLFDEEAGDKMLVFTVFSEDEAYHIQDLFCRTDN